MPESKDPENASVIQVVSRHFLKDSAGSATIRRMSTSQTISIPFSAAYPFFGPFSFILEPVPVPPAMKFRRPTPTELQSAPSDHYLLMAEPALLSVFISYSNRDRVWRGRIASALKERSFEVLDDTLTTSQTDWQIELQRMWQRARIAILLVSPDFIRSETIQKQELPRLLALQNKHSLGIIPVIIRPCPWQQEKSIANLQVFPEGGRPLSQGDEAQIQSDLSNLALAVESLADAVALAAHEEKSTPAAQPSLAQKLALGLGIRHADTFYPAMASLVAPSLAVTSYDVLVESGLKENDGVGIDVEFLGSSPLHTTKATVLVADESENIVLLQLQSSAPFDWPTVSFPTSPMDSEGRWQSYVKDIYVTDASGTGASYVGIDLEGTFARSTTSKGHSYQVLKPSPASLDGLRLRGILKPRETPVYVGGLAGAPILLDHPNTALVGIVSGIAGSSLRGIPVSQALIEKLSASSSEPKKPSQWFDQATIDRFSKEVRALLQRADAIRKQNGLRRIHPPDLLLALAEQKEGQLFKLLADAKVDLLSLIAPKRVDIEWPKEESQIHGLPRISLNVRKALSIARDKANESGPATTIEAAYVLYGILCSDDSSGLVPVLHSHGITPDKVKLPSKATDTAKPEPFSLAGYNSDDPTGTDLLGIEKEVEALATILAAKDVDPPLSLGLFGDWGSGKSFFMRQLEQRIRELQADAKKAQEADEATAYCEDIVQLTFNAWNYIDTNLWASLASSIFEGLASAIAGRRAQDSQEERALVLAAACSSQTALAEAERKKDAAEQELKQTEERLTALQQSQTNIEAELSPMELFKQAWRFAIAQDRVREPIDHVVKELRIAEGTASAGEIRAEILELHGIWKKLIFTMRRNKNLGLWIGATVIALGLGALATALLQRYDLRPAASHAVAALVAISGFLATFRVWARKAWSFIEQAQKSKQDLVEQKKAEKTAELKGQYEEVQKKVTETQAAVAQAAKNVETLNQQLENMRADRQMADYIRRRYESSDYTRHLGIIAQVRADFRHLSILLRDVRQESERERKEREQEQEKEIKERQKEKDAERLQKGGKPLFPRIDRIILYIDDLDRCPEKNVIEVLQAVHLLLAFPLFVVVVGVDPRWLLHSLEQHSAVFQAEAKNGSIQNEEAATEDDFHWRSTPMNYLEKIFQIPFALRPIDRTGFGKLVDKFAAPGLPWATHAKAAPPPVAAAVTSIKAPAPAPMPVQVAAGAAAGVVASTQPAVSSPATTPPPPSGEQVPLSKEPVEQKTAAAAQMVASHQPAEPARVVNRNPEHLRIEQYERDFMKTLHEFIPSPRAGKRFINIYRLLRASVQDKERAAFVGDAQGGDYQSALMLLAIMTGYPAEAAEILRLLMEEKPQKSWGAFLLSCKSRYAGNSSAAKSKANGAPAKDRGKTPKASSPVLAPAPESDRWQELFENLEGLKDKLSDRPCDSFRRWAARVARYSFQSGRTLLYARDP